MTKVRSIAALGGAILLAGCQSVGPSPSAPTSAASLVPGATGGAESTAAAPSTSQPPAPTAATEPPGASQPAASSPNPSWSPQPQPTVALSGDGAPELPTKVRVASTDQPCDFGTDEACYSWQASWVEADPTAVTVRVYAVTECLHAPTGTSEASVKCLVSGDTIPLEALVLLGSAPAEDGSLTFQLAGTMCGLGQLPGQGPSVDAIVVQAINDAGGSLFAYGAVSSTCVGAL
jgi:hypothetical protein